MSIDLFRSFVGNWTISVLDILWKRRSEQLLCYMVCNYLIAGCWFSSWVAYVVGSEWAMLHRAMRGLTWYCAVCKTAAASRLSFLLNYCTLDRHKPTLLSTFALWRVTGHLHYYTFIDLIRTQLLRTPTQACNLFQNDEISCCSAVTFPTSR